METKENENFALSRINYIMLGIGILIVIVGLICMSGSGSTSKFFNPEIFSARRIFLAPILSLFGYLFIIFAIMYRPCSKKKENEQRLETQGNEK